MQKKLKNINFATYKMHYMQVKITIHKPFGKMIAKIKELTPKNVVLNCTFLICYEMYYFNIIKQMVDEF